MIESLRFTREFLRDRRQIGALIPSGRPLATAMVSALGRIEPGQVVVELGPGTGVVTRRIEQEWPGHRLLAIEFKASFAEALQTAFPSAEVIHGCASRLADHLGEKDVAMKQVGGVISSLPLLSLRPESRRAIFAGLRAILLPGRRYVQFTYSRRSWKRFLPEGFELHRERRVWRNLPPATVLTFVRVAASGKSVGRRPGDC